ncbi:MAG: flagellar basal body-associated FliL family protein [Tateyamaria sp.]|uniref:flagellar basal body-associated FliL family protein n=1 Tax=Tateyamaria sp. TaxID=1929288 RepID=UPI00326C43E7
MTKLFPLILLLIGVGAGVGAGVFLRPEVVPVVEDMDSKMEEAGGGEEIDEGDPASEYVKMSNQFVVPIVDGDSVKGLVVMSLTLEVIAGQKDAVYTREPKLRDSFLQVMFDHANIGGFDGAFTNASNLAVLRGALLEVSQKVMGKQVTDVLIVEIARQDY